MKRGSQNLKIITALLVIITVGLAAASIYIGLQLQETEDVNPTPSSANFGALESTDNEAETSSDRALATALEEDEDGNVEVDVRVTARCQEGSGGSAGSFLEINGVEYEYEYYRYDGDTDNDLSDRQTSGTTPSTDTVTLRLENDGSDHIELFEGENDVILPNELPDGIDTAEYVDYTYDNQLETEAQPRLYLTLNFECTGPGIVDVEEGDEERVLEPLDLDPITTLSTGLQVMAECSTSSTRIDGVEFDLNYSGEDSDIVEISGTTRYVAEDDLIVSYDGDNLDPENLFGITNVNIPPGVIPEQYSQISYSGSKEVEALNFDDNGDDNFNVDGDENVVFIYLQLDCTDRAPQDDGADDGADDGDDDGDGNGGADDGVGNDDDQQDDGGADGGADGVGNDDGQQDDGGDNDEDGDGSEKFASNDDGQQDDGGDTSGQNGGTTGGKNEITGGKNPGSTPTPTSVTGGKLPDTSINTSIFLFVVGLTVTMYSVFVLNKVKERKLKISLNSTGSFESENRKTAEASASKQKQLQIANKIKEKAHKVSSQFKAEPPRTS